MRVSLTFSRRYEDDRLRVKNRATAPAAPRTTQRLLLNRSLLDRNDQEREGRSVRGGGSESAFSGLATHGPAREPNDLALTCGHCGSQRDQPVAHAAKEVVYKLHVSSSSCTLANPSGGTMNSSPANTRGRKPNQSSRSRRSRSSFAQGRCRTDPGLRRSRSASRG